MSQLTNKAKHVTAVFTDKSMIDGVITELVNSVLDIYECKAKVTHCKHYTDPKTNYDYVELIIDEKETD